MPVEKVILKAGSTISIFDRSIWDDLWCYACLDSHDLDNDKIRDALRSVSNEAWKLGYQGIAEELDIFLNETNKRVIVIMSSNGAPWVPPELVGSRR